MDPHLINALIAIVQMSVGALAGYLVSRNTKQLIKTKLRNVQLSAEIRARQSEEDVACAWLLSVGATQTLLTAKRELRKRTFDIYGRMVSMSPSSLH